MVFGSYAMRLFFLIICCLCLGACVPTRPAEAPGIRAVTPQEAVGINDAVNRSQRARLGEDGRYTILALSGGGADGAFAAGVLNGWSQSGERPKFDVVTGVSTGALISVFAFMGPAYDGLLKQLYTSGNRDDILQDRGLQGLFSDALYDNAPLKKQIERLVTPAFVEAVAREHRAGRRLYVATTNLDGGELVVWDMGALAAGEGGGRANKVQTFQKVLRASAAIPVFFPPVYIKPTRGVQLRQAHVDGGLKAPVLVSDFIFDVPAKRRELYLIISGKLALEDANAPVKPELRSIAGKSVRALMQELTHQAVYRAYVRARLTGTDYNVTAIPDRIPPLADPLAFEVDYLRRIYKIGFDDAIKGNGFWWKEPPTLKRFDRVSRR